MVDWKGWVRTSLIDYPEHIACVLFAGGCNLRCPCCHNSDLVLRPGELPSLVDDEVWTFLARRVGRIDGVVVTGGEPTLQPDLLPFLRRVREFRLDIKLDTNGTRPDVLAAAFQEGLLDYVAMDVKAPLHKYPLLSGRLNLDLDLIQQSIALLRQSGVEYEFRTTVVPRLLGEDDVEAIARWLQGSRRYALQQFRAESTLEPVFSSTTPYPRDRLWEMARRAGRWIEEVEVRGA